MGAALKTLSTKRSGIPPGCLPPRMRVLYITTYHRTGGWLAEAFASDSACEVVLEEAIGVSAGLGRLRDEAFDAVLISHEPGELDALDLLDGLRPGGSDEPIIILGVPSEQELEALAYEVGADAYVCVNTTTTRALIWTVARAVERHLLIRDNRRLAQAERHRLEQEHREAERLLDEQRSLIRDLERIHVGESRPADDAPAPSAGHRVAARAAADDAFPLPEALVAHYRELLRAHVIMGSGNLASEMKALAHLLVSANVTAQQTMQLHLEALEELVKGLGNRSSRHVMTRADLLVLEVMVHLAKGYQARYLGQLHPPRQQFLPGMDGACLEARDA